MRVAVVALLLTFALTFGILPDVQAGHYSTICVNVDDEVNRFKVRNANLVNLELYELTPDEVLNFMSNYNALPPVSTQRADRILVFSSNSKPNVVVFLIIDDCIRAIQGVPLPKYREMMVEVE